MILIKKPGENINFKKQSLMIIRPFTRILDMNPTSFQLTSKLTSNYSFQGRIIYQTG